VRLVVSRAAVADFERLHRFLAEKDRSAAQRAAAAIDDAVRALADFPQRGRPSGIAGMRELIVPFAGRLKSFAMRTWRDEMRSLFYVFGMGARNGHEDRNGTGFSGLEFRQPKFDSN